MTGRWVACVLFLMQFGSVGAAEKLRIAFEARKDLEAKFSQLSPAGQKLWNQILADEDQASEPIGFDGICGRMLNFTDQLSDSDFDNLTSLINRSVAPDVGRAGLVQIVNSSRRALETLQFDYVVDTLRFDPDQFDRRNSDERPTQIVASFATHGPKVYLTEILTRGGVLLRKQSSAFDGEILRESVKYPHHAVTNSGVSRLTNRKSFFPSAHPLRRAMVIDPKRDLSESQASSEDLMRRVIEGIVFPGFSVVDGKQCVVISNFTDILYCAPELGYAVVQSKISAMRFDQSAGRFVKRPGYLLISNSDFQELPSGVWLPRRMEYQRSVEDGSLGEHTVTTVKKYSTNAPPDELFVKVIPDGAVVSDSVQHAIYTAGNDQDLQARLKQASSPKSLQNRYAVLIGGNLLAILCLAVVVYIRSRTRAAK